MNLIQRLWQPRIIPGHRTPDNPEDRLGLINEAVAAQITRGRGLSDDLSKGWGPNWVHVAVVRGKSGEFGRPGDILDLGWHKNLKTTAGMDWLHNTMGGAVTPTLNTPATNTTATAVTGTGSGLTSNALTGYRIFMPVTGLTTPPVYGNILSNTTSVIQIDQWWTAADGTGTTPASTSAYTVGAGGLASARFIALTNDAGAPAVGDTSLASEITANGLGRALATYAHTPGATTFTQTKTWTASGTQSAQKAGLMSGGYGAGGGGIMFAETQFTAASLASGDSLQLTWTVTLPSAG